MSCSARLNDLHAKLDAAFKEHDQLASQADKLRGDVSSAISLLEGLKKQAKPDQQCALLPASVSSSASTGSSQGMGSRNCGQRDSALTLFLCAGGVHCSWCTSAQ